MKYMNKTIAEATSEELLHALLKKNGIETEPKEAKYSDRLLESFIAIDNGRKATIFFSVDDLEALHRHIE